MQRRPPRTSKGIPDRRRPPHPYAVCQALGPERLLPLRARARPRDSLAATGGRTPGTRVRASLHLFPRRPAQPVRSGGAVPSPRGAAGRAHVSRAAAPAVRSRLARRGGPGTRPGGRRPARRIAHRARNEVLPDPTRSGRTGPRASTGIVRHNPSGVPPSCRGRSDLSRQLRRDSAQDENRPQGLRRLAPPRRRAQRGGSSLPTAFA